MRPDDLEAAIAAIRDGGWGDRRATLEFCLRHSETHPLLAESDGAVVGTAIATQHGSVGWVGLVFVTPAWRGRGLGGQLTNATLRRLDEVGCRSAVLAATELGRPIYERLGFAVAGEYVMVRGPARAEAPSDPRIRRMLPADLASVCAVDRGATDEDRAHVIRAMDDGWVVENHGIVRGYALRTPWGLGPVIAEDAADGMLLLDVLRSQAPAGAMTITIVGANAAAAAHLRAVGFREERRLPRMVLGPPIAWRPERVWTIFSFAMG